MQPCVYILASSRNGTLYIGVTNDVIRRIWEHRSKAVDGFAARYSVHRLVYAEFHDAMAVRSFGRNSSRNGAVLGSCS